MTATLEQSSPATVNEAPFQYTWRMFQGVLENSNRRIHRTSPLQRICECCGSIVFFPDGDVRRYPMALLNPRVKDEGPKDREAIYFGVEMPKETLAEFAGLTGDNVHYRDVVDYENGTVHSLGWKDI